MLVFQWAAEHLAFLGSGKSIALDFSTLQIWLFVIISRHRRAVLNGAETCTTSLQAQGNPCGALRVLALAGRRFAVYDLCRVMGT
jgi:hypothetical protein